MGYFLAGAATLGKNFDLGPRGIMVLILPFLLWSSPKPET
jgi:hypothetical protein